MKKIILVAALATVAACNQADTTAEPAATEEAADAAVATTAADGGPSTGTFKVTLQDGSEITAEVKLDGTYSVTDASGAVTDTGKWEQKSPELYCETSDKEGSTQVCYEEKVDENGVYTSKNPNTGEVATVVRVEAGAE